MLPDPIRAWLFALTLFATVFTAAVNCYTLVVTYPLWRTVDDRAFAQLHRDYLRRLWPVVTLPHVVLFFASLLSALQPPHYLAANVCVLVFVVAAAVVALSLALAGPVHDRFTRQGRVDRPGMRRLRWVSALRSGLLLASSALLLYEMRAGLLGK